MLEKARKMGVNFAIDEERFVIWTETSNKKVEVSQNSKNKIFELNIKK